VTKDTFLIRSKDVGLLIAILTLAGLVLGPMKKVFQLEATIGKVEKLEDRVNGNEKNIAVINSQYADISKQLDQINWQLRRLNR
jgi:uncharacterized coiled-coil protein SlyX